MRSVDSSGANLSITDNENEISTDSNPYAYPYFHSDPSSSSSVYDLVVRFGACLMDSASCSRATFVKRIKKRCLFQPHEASWRDSCGDTALHRLCQVPKFSKGFLGIARALLDAFPEATTATNNWQETPLHQFVNHCGQTAEDDVDGERVEFFLVLTRHGAAGRVNYWGSYPLHDACALQQANTLHKQKWFQSFHHEVVEQLAKQFPGALVTKDSSGMTPLHAAIDALKCDARTIGLLLRSTTDTSMRESSMTLLIRHYFEPFKNNNMAKTMTTRSSFIISALERNTTDPKQLVHQLGSVWDTTVLLARCFDGNATHEQNHFWLVHSVIKAKCPYCVVALALRLHPEQLLVRNDEGMTPLSCVLSSPSTTWNDDWSRIMRLVLSANPKAIAMPDSRGRLPFHVATTGATGHWPELQELFRAEPRAIMTRDPVTRLFPFMLPAINNKNTSPSSVDVIYEMLRADPSVMNHIIA